ncbi:MAG: ribosomal protein S18-alanine N-acetyltransferase [Holosporaceae bacterium]|jgi:ribosomal-protein-alanine N-acetyltransferase|nr:ribosomal protein S18-alanine N-acetyltransferase [Holosporaceae bacterium]
MLIELSTDDVESLEKIHGSCFDESWSAKSFREMLSSDVFFGFAHKDKTINGFVLCKMVCNEIEIITFCVLQEFRNQGIGKALIDQIDHYAERHLVGKIFLEVAEDNVVARKIYESRGYEEISRRKEYYQRKSYYQNAIIMCKNIFMDC